MSLKTIGVGLLIAVTVPIGTALTTFDPGTITNWRARLVGLAAGAVRQIAVTALAMIAARKTA